MRKFALALMIAATSMVCGPAALAQQEQAATAVPAVVAVSDVLGTYKGNWKSNTSAATGELIIQVTGLGADNRVTGKLSMTRPQNNTPRWSCVDTPIDFTGDKQGDQFTLAVDFKGGCNKNSFTFSVKDGKIDGVYQTQSGASGVYTLSRQEIVAAQK